MVDEAVGSVIVVGGDGRPAGIVTDRDLRERVLAAGRPPEQPVAGIMSSPVVTVSPEAFLSEVLLEMTRRDIHHLAVVEAGRLIGVVSSHDFLVRQAAGPLDLARAVRAAHSLDELATLGPRLTEAIRHLFAQHLSGYEIGRLVAEMSDALVRRVLAIVERDLKAAGEGEAPGRWCWLALGSEGRREQTLRTDQDNAFVYEDLAPGARAPAERYFHGFTERVVASLVRLGYPRCPADSMASNPKWCQPLAVWRTYFADWVRETTPEHLMYSSIYLDFRPVGGDSGLAAALRDEVRTQVTAWRSFPRYLAKVAVSHGPPLGLFGRFQRRRQGDRRGVDLKLGGMLILTNALRAYAVEMGLEETNTIERLEAAMRVEQCFTPSEAGDVRDAYETIFQLRLRHQLAQLATGERPDNFLDPSGLPDDDQRRLREAFRAIERLQGKLEDRYLTEML